MTGHIFFDNNTLGEICRRHLATPIRGSLRAVDLRVQPTELNLIEAYAAPGNIAEDLVWTLRELAGHHGALPWTGELLRLAGLAFLEGRSGVQLPLNEIDPELLALSRDMLRHRLDDFRRNTDRSHARLHADARRKLQRKLKEVGVRPRWEDFPVFLEAWQNLEVREIFARQSWADLGLPAPFPPAVLAEVDSWRLMSDADAIGLYQAALAFEQPRQVQRMDQLQLPYLGGASRQLLVTRDGPFFQAASSVLHGRYPLTRVVKLEEFLRASAIE